MRARAYSKKLVDMLLEKVSVFRTRPFNVHPIAKEISHELEPTPKNTPRVLWRFRNGKKFLKIFGINARERKDGIIIRAIEDIIKFSREISFLRESKVRKGKRFSGSAKNDVLKLMIMCSLLTSMGNWINKNFSNINELQNFLLTSLRFIENYAIKDLVEFLKIKLNMEIDVNFFYTQLKLAPYPR